MHHGITHNSDICQESCPEIRDLGVKTTELTFTPQMTAAVVFFSGCRHYIGPSFILIR